MPPSSSISSSEGRPSEPRAFPVPHVDESPLRVRVWWRYLGTMLILAAASIAAAWLIIDKHLREHGPKIPYQVLFAHQLEKLERPTASTLFLGDSSLGNAISAAHWETLSNGSATNLALTGSYGYAGSYNLLRRALTRGRPDAVVIMHTADMPTRQTPKAAFELTQPEGNAWQRLERRWQESMNLTQLGSALETLVAARENTRLPGGAGATVIRDDYIAQSESIVAPELQSRKLHPRAIKRANLEYLYQLSSLCQRERINCVYAHGPLARGSCHASKDYLAAASQAIRKTGLALASAHPLCLEENEVGDAPDHVRPTRKRHTTERYYKLLKPFLR